MSSSLQHALNKPQVSKRRREVSAEAAANSSDLQYMVKRLRVDDSMQQNQPQLWANATHQFTAPPPPPPQPSPQQQRQNRYQNQQFQYDQQQQQQGGYLNTASAPQYHHDISRSSSSSSSSSLFAQQYPGQTSKEQQLLQLQSAAGMNQLLGNLHQERAKRSTTGSRKLPTNSRLY